MKKLLCKVCELLYLFLVCLTLFLWTIVGIIPLAIVFIFSIIALISNKLSLIFIYIENKCKNACSIINRYIEICNQYRKDKTKLFIIKHVP